MDLTCGSVVKNPPAMRETWIQSLGWEDPLQKGKVTTPVFWPGEFHGLSSPWGCKEKQLSNFNFTCTLYLPGESVVKNPVQETLVQPLGQEGPLEKKMATHSSILTWEIPSEEEPCELQSMRLQ